MILLSYSLSSETPVYKARHPVRIQQTGSIEQGDVCNQLEISMTNHSGTHIDCPAHFFAAGKTLTDFENDFWYCRNPIVANTKSLELDVIKPDDLRFETDKRNQTADIVILKTGHGALRGKTDYWERQAGIHPTMAEYLRNEFPNIRFFGFDLISLSSPQHREMGQLAHREFLKSERPILIIEDMNFSDLPGGGLRNILISPLMIEKADGAPCTVWGNL